MKSLDLRVPVFIILSSFLWLTNGCEKGDRSEIYIIPIPSEIEKEAGEFKLYSFDLSNHFELDILSIEKYVPEKIYSVTYYDGQQKYYYAKRFQIEETDKKLSFIGEHKKSELVTIATEKFPRVEISFGGAHSNRLNEIIDLESFIGIKSFKARGKRLTTYQIDSIKKLEPIIQEEEIKEYEEKYQNNENKAPIISKLEDNNIKQASLFDKEGKIDFDIIDTRDND